MLRQSATPRRRCDYGSRVESHQGRVSALDKAIRAAVRKPKPKRKKKR